MILHIRKRRSLTQWERAIEEEVRRRHIENRVELEELEQNIIEHGSVNATIISFRPSSSGKRRRRNILGIRIAIRH
ncbi:hypothetical protein Pyrde_1761 [Pyrodictium delaneyi]|uniref:Uncharacterized protein n=1 Tax=Pyrodictium delaneyi TaxID=1273541 RepID=A0A0P0N689_9CREN|nr:hypothetical protein [Pyrodictium delaneyi]ALL01804.1 hypothetical protein Pyrde_1761 [Pyrodictium delaneyi]OWJ54980.1 hypothetical protein Pdsh_04610 [Pyrodictium delaneyi]